MHRSLRQEPCHPRAKIEGRGRLQWRAVNDAHPTCQRAAASRSEGYHIALTAAMSLARLAVEADRSHDFVTAFMAEWGRAGNGRRR